MRTSKGRFNDRLTRYLTTPNKKTFNYLLRSISTISADLMQSQVALSGKKSKSGWEPDEFYIKAILSFITRWDIHLNERHMKNMTSALAMISDYENPLLDAELIESQGEECYVDNLFKIKVAGALRMLLSRSMKSGNFTMGSVNLPMIKSLCALEDELESRAILLTRDAHYIPLNIDVIYEVRNNIFDYFEACVGGVPVDNTQGLQPLERNSSLKKILDSFHRLFQHVKQLDTRLMQQMLNVIIKMMHDQPNSQDYIKYLQGLQLVFAAIYKLEGHVSYLRKSSGKTRTVIATIDDLQKDAFEYFRFIVQIMVDPANMTNRHHLLETTTRFRTRSIDKVLLAQMIVGRHRHSKMRRMLNDFATAVFGMCTLGLAFGIKLGLSTIRYGTSKAGLFSSLSSTASATALEVPLKSVVDAYKAIPLR